MGRPTSKIIFFLFLLGIIFSAPLTAKGGRRCNGNNCGGWSGCSGTGCGGQTGCSGTGCGGWSTCSGGACGQPTCSGGNCGQSVCSGGNCGGTSWVWNGSGWVPATTSANPTANPTFNAGSGSATIPQGFNPTQSSNGYRLIIDRGQTVPEGAHSYAQGPDGATQYADSNGKIIGRPAGSTKSRAEKESAPNPAETEDWDPLIAKIAKALTDPEKMVGTNSVNGITSDLYDEHIKRSEAAKAKVEALDASDIDGRKAEALKNLKEINAWLNERWSKLIAQLKKKAVEAKDNRFLAVAAGLKQSLKKLNEDYEQAIALAPLDMKNHMACIACKGGVDAISSGLEELGFLAGKKGEAPDFNGYLARWKGKAYRLTIDHDSGQPAISESAEGAETDLDRSSHKELLAKIKTYYDKADTTKLTAREKETITAFNKWLTEQPKVETPKYADKDAEGSQTNKKGARDAPNGPAAANKGPTYAGSMQQIWDAIKDERENGDHRPVMVIVTKGNDASCPYCVTLHQQMAQGSRQSTLDSKFRVVYVNPNSHYSFAREISNLYGGYYSGGFVYDWDNTTKSYRNARTLPYYTSVVGEIDRYATNSYASR